VLPFTAGSGDLFIFPVDVAISGTCGALSAYSAAGRLGLYRTVAGSAQLPPLTDAQRKTVNKGLREIHKDYKLAKKYHRADTRRQKRRLVAKGKRLDKQAKDTVKEWKNEGLPAKQTDPNAAEPIPLWAYFEALKAYAQASAIVAADCLFGASGGHYCDDAPPELCRASNGARGIECIDAPVAVGFRPGPSPGADD
jgi:hypothetical protein